MSFQPSWKREQEARRRRAKRRLALFVIGAGAIVLLLGVGLGSWLGSDATQVTVGVPEEAVEQAPEPVEEAPLEIAGTPEPSLEDEMAQMPAPEESSANAELWGPPEPFTRLSAILQQGDTLGTALEAAGVAPATTQKVIDLLRGVLDFRRIRPQDHVQILVNHDGTLLEFEFERGINEIYRIREAGGKMVAVKEQREFDRRLEVITGRVESTLFEAIAAVGETPELIMNFVDIFAWAIDFSIFTRKGDSFRILVEKLYDRGVFRGYGSIFAAEYVNNGQSYDAAYFEAPDGFAGYFDHNGDNLRRAFLRAPLQFNRITSSFTYSRFHPVLKSRRPHLGVDYAAPTGTPIWSIADGVVTGAGWMGGSGRAVKIRHRNGIETSYSHLSRFGRGIRRGLKVRQKQIIGYVGASGLATGPHLHFGMKKNGRAVNPAGIALPKGDPVPRKYLAMFRAERERWWSELEQRSRPEVLPVAAQ